MAKKNKGRKVQPNQRMVWVSPHKKKKGESVASEMSKKDYMAKYINENGYMPMEAWYESEENEDK